MRLIRLGIVAIVAIIGFSLFFVTVLYSRATVEPIPTIAAATAPNSNLSNLDPAYYGLPSTIAGYRIILVQTSENFACVPAGTVNLVLRSLTPDVDIFLNQSSNGDVITELKKLKLEIHPTNWGFLYVGPGISDEHMRQVAHERDPKNVRNCVRLGRIS